MRNLFNTIPMNSVVNVELVFEFYNPHAYFFSHWFYLNDTKNIF